MAEVFGKEHRDVLKAVRKLDCSKEFTERNFALSEYKDSTGRFLPAYTITRDGFTLLAMGFTGKQDFSDWINDRIAKYGFVKNRDFTVVKNDHGGNSRFTTIDYHVSIDMAKELATPSILRPSENPFLDCPGGAEFSPKRGKRFFADFGKKPLCHNFMKNLGGVM